MLLRNGDAYKTNNSLKSSFKRPRLETPNTPQKSNLVCVDLTTPKRKIK